MSRGRERPRRDATEGPYCNEIVLHPDGSVAFKHLTLDLLELAAELAPDDDRVRQRLLRAAARKPT